MEGDTESEGREFVLELEMGSRITSARNRNAESIILRLPNHFQRYGKFTFDPEIVSIGPYHRGEDHLKLMEDKKWPYLDRLFMRFRFTDYQSYYAEAKSLVNEAKRCYRDELDSDMANDHNFALMLLLDGSFILECLFPCDRRLPASLSSVASVRGPLAFDLIKFENQIPFFVLERLYACLNKGRQYPDDITTLVSKYITRFYIQIPSLDVDRGRIARRNKFHHLLDVFHLCVYAAAYEPRAMDTIPWIPTACALQEAGIKIKRLLPGGFLEVSFDGGTLMMSPLIIDHRTHSMFHNFLAWEQYRPGEGNFVTSYCTFIGCLVKTAADVLLLRQAEILTNHLGSDEQASRLINSLPKYLGDEEFTLWKVFDGINQHCQSRLNRYEARLRRDYCGHPWAIISVLAAFVLLVLASVQTVYSVLSFYHKK